MSDLHVGSGLFRADLLEAAIDEANTLAPDLVAVPGDLTTEGYRHEFEQAREFLSRLECPSVLVTMGNHDARNVGYRHFEDFFGLRERAWLGIDEGDSFPLDETYCERLLDGRIGSIVSDAQHDARVADIEATHAVGIGAYIGVPLRVDDVRLYVLCCVAREARPGLADADVRFLKGLGETVMAELKAPA